MNQETLQKIVNRFGKQTQINKVHEECLELALVLNQMNCPTKDVKEMEDKLYSELADVQIMVAQFPFLFDQDRIDKIVAEKLERAQKYFFEVGEVVLVKSGQFKFEYYVIEIENGMVLIASELDSDHEDYEDMWVDLNELEKHNHERTKFEEMNSKKDIKKNYIKISLDNQGPSVIQTLDEAIEFLKNAINEVGEKYTFEIVEMSENDVQALPEFKGF